MIIIFSISSLLALLLFVSLLCVSASSPVILIEIIENSSYSLCWNSSKGIAHQATRSLGAVSE